MATRMQQRRGTAQQWTEADPILAAGEIGFETDTSQFKIGDGVNAWSVLSYFKNLEDLGGTLDDYVPLTQKGASNGVATLDGSGKIPSSQIPELVGLDSEISAAVSAAVSDLVNGAPAALDTLNEIATLIGDGSSIAGTLISNISQIDTSVNELGTSVTEHTATLGTLGGVVSGHTTTISSNTTAINNVVNNLEDHSSATTDVHGIADTSLLATQTDITDTETYADNAVSAHNLDETNVHGISNTANLVYTTDSRLSDERTPSAGSVTATKIASDAVTTAKILDANVTTAKIADSAITSAKIADATIVDGDISSSAAIAQSKISGLTSDLAAKLASATAASTYAPIASPTFTGTVNGITKSMVGLGNVDNTADSAKPVSTAQQTALDLKAPLAGPTFTGTVVLPSTTSIGNVSATEIGYVDGVTSAIQTQIDSKLSKSGGTMTGDLTLAGAPTSDLHAATKAYVDNVSAGLNFHQPVRVATTANITLSGTQTIDGVSLSVGDRVLVKDQTTQTQNGIYVVASGSWTRATDADNNPTGELAGGDFCLVLEGTVGSGYGYVCSNTSAITVGTTNITYAAFNAAKAIVAGSGLTESTPGTLDIATGGVTSAMIADGTIVDGDINASAAIAQSKISGLSSSLALKANLAAPSFTGGVTVDSSGIIFADGTQTKEGVPSRTPIQQKTASYTLSALTERDNMIEVSSTSATTITIPTNATLALPVGTSIDILQTNTGQVTIAGAAGVTVNATPGLKLRTQWSAATLFKRATDTWVVTGDLSA